MQLTQHPKSTHSHQSFYSAPVMGAGAVGAKYLEQFLALDNMTWNHLRSEKDRIAKLKSREENWDGHGSAKPSSIAADWATQAVLPALYDCVATLPQQWVPPHITASEAGEIVFEWWSAKRKITLYISESAIEYIRVWGSNVDNEMEAKQLVDSTDFRAAWMWLFA